MEYEYNYFRFTKTNESTIQVFKNGKWDTLHIKGIHLSSFVPGYGRYKTSIDKAQVLKWLKEIETLNVNVIKIPGIQPPSFYNAIYDHNQEAKNPIYTIHEVMLDEKAVLKHYDIYHGTIKRNFKKDIKNTINVIHGRAAVFTNSRSHKGLYLKDISKYNLGYILGTNTNPEIVTLTDSKYSHINSFEGDYFKLEKGSPFEAFIAESMDIATSYEMKKYNQISLISYLTDIETDPLEYEHEANRTRHAKINMENIQAYKLDHMFIAYKFHPNAVDFLEYEYEDIKVSAQSSQDTIFYKHLMRLNNFYKSPLIISDTGIPSSRGISKVDRINGFNRGGFSEQEQGENIVKLLKTIDETGSAGAIVHAWQDDWTSLTSFSMVGDYLDESASSYWFDAQSSDESFGLLSFEFDDDNKVYIDGEIKEWEFEDYIINDQINLKAKSDRSFLYLLIEKQDWSLKDEEIYLGIDITPKSGSNYWEKEEAFFLQAVDCIIKLSGYNESKIVIHERYDLFNYLYKYYSHVIEKEDKIPAKDSNNFSEIYLLNRKKFYLIGRDEIIQPVYYQTGKLTHGNGNPNAGEYNSLVDFNKTGDYLEIKIPWTMLNIKNPIEMFAYDDFYLAGIEKKIKINDIGFSIYDKETKMIFNNDQRYKVRNKEKIKYKQRLKESYHILKEFWADDF